MEQVCYAFSLLLKGRFQKKMTPLSLPGAATPLRCILLVEIPGTIPNTSRNKAELVPCKASESDGMCVLVRYGQRAR